MSTLVAVELRTAITPPIPLAGDAGGGSTSGGGSSSSAGGALARLALAVLRPEVRISSPYLGAEPITVAPAGPPPENWRPGAAALGLVALAVVALAAFGAYSLAK